MMFESFFGKIKKVAMPEENDMHVILLGLRREPAVYFLALL